MISSCLVQSASAVESRNGELTIMSSITNGGTVSKGSALITNNAVPSMNIKIEDGGVEIVENGKTSVGSTIKKGGIQIVTRGGNAQNAKIHGGQQFVHEEKDLDLTSVERKSSAYDTTVTGSAGAVGQQNIYDGAEAWKTKVEKDGEQNLYARQRKEGGKATATEISDNGRQHVLARGEAVKTNLKGQAIQVVYPGGLINGLTITDSAKSWLHVGAQKTIGEVRVNNKGELYLFAGDVKNHITKKEISITGRLDEPIFEVGERKIGEKPQIEIEDLGGQDGTVIFTSIPYDPRHISLHVEKLSGSLNFRFNVSASGDASDYLSISKGAGNHKISVADSGREITAPFSQKNGFVTELPLITDRSPDGGANFTLVDLSGAGITTVDGGTYQYSLQKRERCADSSGSATTWYLGRASGGMERSDTEGQCVNKKAKTPVALPAGSGKQSDQGISSGRKNTGSRKSIKKEQPKPRPPRHLREAQSVSRVFVSSSQENQVIEVSGSSGPHFSSNAKQQAVVLESSHSLADQMILRPTRAQEQPSPQMNETLSVSDFLTTPSTDAVLSMSVAPAMVFHNEMQSVRTGRGILDKSKKNTALWSYAIKSKESITTKHIDFKLDQTGIVLGVNGLSEWENGAFYIGGFGSYDRASIAHARGGKSGINSYGVGAYVTYLDHSGWYLDGVLKYNHYQNTLKAVSTNGLGIEGTYTQWAVGSSFEAGYRFQMSQSSWLQPYGQFTWLKVEGNEIQLSNDMTSDIRPFTSLRSEVGLSLGYEFSSHDASSSLAYITAAWLREHKDDNQTLINHRHAFTTDVSGNAGKLGIGLSSLVSEKLKLYGEAHYIKGHKTKQSLQGIIGVRYSF